MLRSIKHLLAILCFATVVQGQALPIRNDTPTTLRDLGSDLNVGRNFAVDQYGYQKMMCADSGSGLIQSVVPVSNATSLNGVGSVPIGFISAATDTAEAGSTATVINATSHAARVGDVIQPYSGTAGNVNVWTYVTAVTANTITVGKAFPATVAASDNFYIWRPTIIQATNPATGAGGALAVAVDRQNQISVAGGLLKAEDAAHTSGDAGVMGLAVNNRSQAVFSSTQLDYVPIGTGDYGEVTITMSPTAQTFANSAIQAEDAGFGSGSGLVMAGGVWLGTSAQAASPAGTAQDAVPFNTDAINRLMINPWGQNVANFGSTCGTATATTSDVAIASAVASNRIYVSGVTCASSDADNATNINFKDGSTVVAVGGVSQMAAGAAGTFTANFNPPIRGTSNTAFNFNTAVSTSSVICCATYFTSTS